MSHFKAKMHQILFPASVRSSVRPSVRLLDGVWHYKVTFDIKSLLRRWSYLTDNQTTKVRSLGIYLRVKRRYCSLHLVQLDHEIFVCCDRIDVIVNNERTLVSCHQSIESAFRHSCLLKTIAGLCYHDMHINLLDFMCFEVVVHTWVTCYFTVTMSWAWGPLYSTRTHTVQCDRSLKGEPTGVHTGVCLYILVPGKLPLRLSVDAVLHQYIYQSLEDNCAGSSRRQWTNPAGGIGHGAIVSRRTTNKKLTKLYWPPGKRSLI